MEEISVLLEKTSFSTGGMQTGLFRPIKRAVSDLTYANIRKKRDIVELEARGFRSSHVPIVSVRYDVPRTPPLPCSAQPQKQRKAVFLPLQSLQKSRPDERLGTSVLQLDNPQLKNLGVGKGFEDQGDSFNMLHHSSSTPTAPYSTADIVYNSDINSNKGQLEELRQGSFGDLDRTGRDSSSKQAPVDLPSSNRRPSSKSGSRKSLSIETVSFDRDRDRDQDSYKDYKDNYKQQNNPLPQAGKTVSQFRPNGIRNNIIKGEQLFTSRNNASIAGRDPDDLVAMGTIWSPNQQGSQSQQQQQTYQLQHPSQQQRGSTSFSSALASSNNNGFTPKSLSINSINHPPMSSASSTMTSSRRYPSNNVRPILNQNNSVSGMRNNLKEKDAEPKYPDPLVGAPASFQQRLIELASLEGDTVRWERSKKMKRKKQDRDS